MRVWQFLFGMVACVSGVLAWVAIGHANWWHILQAVGGGVLVVGGAMSAVGALSDTD